MKISLSSLSVAGVLAIVLAGCAGTIHVDGYEASYVDAPAAYERHPRYEHHGAEVYEVEGRYYQKYNGRWVVFHQKPRDLREDRREERREERR